MPPKKIGNRLIKPFPSGRSIRRHPAVAPGTSALKLRVAIITTITHHEMKKSEFIVLRKDEKVNDLSMNELKGGLGGNVGDMSSTTAPAF